MNTTIAQRILLLEKEIALLKSSLPPEEIWPWLLTPENLRAYQCPDRSSLDSLIQELKGQGKSIGYLNWKLYGEETTIALVPGGYAFSKASRWKDLGFTIVPVKEALSYWAYLKREAAQEENW